MSAAWVGVFYRADTAQITRVIMPDTDVGLAKHVAGANEIMVRMPLGIYRTFTSHSDIANYLGLAT